MSPQLTVSCCTLACCLARASCSRFSQVLHLYGSDFEMGVAYGQLMKAEINKLVPEFYAYAESQMGMPTAPLMSFISRFQADSDVECPVGSVTRHRPVSELAASQRAPASGGVRHRACIELDLRCHAGVHPAALLGHGALCCDQPFALVVYAALWRPALCSALFLSVCTMSWFCVPWLLSRRWWLCLSELCVLVPM